MKDIFPQISQWTAENKPFALATVIHTWGSAPRVVGSAMAITKDMDIAGSVSGGCVEGAVMEEAAKVLASGKPKKLAFGIADEDAWAVGLSCGGSLRVFLEPFVAFEEGEKEIWPAMKAAVEDNSGGVLLSHVNEEKCAHIWISPHGSETGSLAGQGLGELALSAYKTRKNQLIEHEGESYFAKVFPRRSHLIIVGAAHISADLISLAKPFGFEITVIDPRKIFTEKLSFPTPPDRIYAQWPQEVLPDFVLDEYTYAVLLTHDPKIDDPATHIFLKSPVAYIGALGSKRTQEKRRKRLLEAGFSEEDFARIHGPVGVPIHAKLPREVALSILAEIISVKNQYL